jgi:Flp pilus assembly protein TadG
MKLKCTQKGLAMVEFAIVAPLLLLIMFGICELGIVLYDQAIITNASREFARVGIVLRDPKPTNADIQDVATNYFNNVHLISFHTGIINPTVIPTGIGGNFGTPVVVTVTYPYHNLVFGNLLNLVSGGAFPNPFILSATTTMNNE